MPQDERPSQFPNDANGDVLRRMLRDGDDLSKPRMIEFCHIFPERRQALAFADIVDDPELEVSISYYKERDMWQAIVRRRMVPTHADITGFELSLASKAESLGGEADGWGCFVQKEKQRSRIHRSCWIVVDAETRPTKFIPPHEPG